MPGTVWYGEAGLDVTGPVMARQAWLGQPWQGAVWYGMAGEAGQGKAGHGQVRHGKEFLGLVGDVTHKIDVEGMCRPCPSSNHKELLLWQLKQNQNQLKKNQNKQN